MLSYLTSVFLNGYSTYEKGLFEIENGYSTLENILFAKNVLILP